MSNQSNAARIHLIDVFPCTPNPLPLHFSCTVLSFSNSILHPPQEQVSQDHTSQFQYRMNTGLGIDGTQYFTNLTSQNQANPTNLPRPLPQTHPSPKQTSLSTSHITHSTPQPTQHQTIKSQRRGEHAAHPPNFDLRTQSPNSGVQAFNHPRNLIAVQVSSPSELIPNLDTVLAFSAQALCSPAGSRKPEQREIGCRRTDEKISGLKHTGKKSNDP